MYKTHAIHAVVHLLAVRPQLQEWTLFWALLLVALFQEQCGVIGNSPEARMGRLEVCKRDLCGKCPEQPYLNLMFFYDLVKG